MATKSDFMAAEEIKAILDGRDKDEQARIIRWVSESVGLSVPSTFMPTSPPPSIGVSTPSSVQAISFRRKDIKTFVAEKGPKNDVQFATVAAYYYQFEAPEGDRKEAIVAQDLQNAARQARGFGFKNATSTLNNAVMLGYFDRVGRGEFKLNAVGENLVAMTLSGGAEPLRSKNKKKTTKQSKGRRRRRKKQNPS